MVRLSFSSILTLSIVTLFSTQVLAVKPGHHDDSLTKPKVLDKFCNKFNAACTDTCLKGKKGEMTVTFSCYKVPPKNQIYHFGCRCNGKEKTQSALKKVAGPIPSTSTTTRSVSSTVTPVVSETVTVTSTSTATTSTVTQYSLSDGGSSQVLQVVEDAALIQVKVAKKASHNKKSKKPQSTFCKEYSGACDRQCSRVKSSPKTQTCKKTHNGVISDSYNLYCLCKNGKLETQHALADIGNDGATSTQTEIIILGTTTASLTSTFTQVSTKVEVVPSTTLVVLAPTGVVRADNPDGSVYGYIGKTSDYDVMSIHSADAAEVSSVFLVKDPSTGNYEVGFTLQPTLFWKLDGTTTGGDFDSPGYTFANLIQGDSIPPPSNSDGNPSQTFSWNIGALSENANSLNSPIRATLNYELSPRWVHRDGTLLDLQMRTSGSLNSDYGLFATAPNSDNGYPEVNFSFEPENPN